MTLQEVFYITRMLLDPDNPSTDLASTPVFKIINGTFLDLRGNSVKYFAARAVPNAARVLTVMLYNRRKVRYIAARLLVNAASGGVASSSPPLENTVLITLPIEATINGTWAVLSHFTADMIFYPWTLVTHLTKAAGGTVLHIGRIEDKRRYLY